jgi:hypothetical protein
MADLSVASAIGSTPQSQAGQTKGLFEQLGKALQSGDLAGAQKVFTAIQQNAPQGAVSQVGQGSSGPSPFAALGRALQSGDLAGAQQAYAQIQQARGQHHHPRGFQGKTNTTADTGTAAGASQAGVNGMIGTNINITT